MTLSSRVQDIRLSASAEASKFRVTPVALPMCNLSLNTATVAAPTLLSHAACKGGCEKADSS